MTPQPLARLIAGLDAAVAMPPRALGAGVTAALKRVLDGDNAWLAPEQRRASHDHYTRHLLHADPAGRYTLVAIAWGPGQQSPIHGHYCWCAVGVYSGLLTETYYREDGAGRPPVALRTVERGAGDLSFDRPLTAIHRIANRGDAVAVSLHVYGINKERVTSGVNRIVG